MSCWTRSGVDGFIRNIDPAFMGKTRAYFSFAFQNAVTGIFSRKYIFF